MRAMLRHPQSGMLKDVPLGAGGSKAQALGGVMCPMVEGYLFV